MKRIKSVLAAMLVFMMMFSAAGCATEKKSEPSFTGVWEYKDTENDISAVYDLNEDGTGTYTMKVGDTEVTYEMKYEIKDGHLLVRFVNNEIFSEDDVFDSEMKFSDSDTVIIKDSTGEEMTFRKKQ